MNVVDSSGWLEFFADGPNAEQFARPLNDLEQLIVPSISVFEVFRVVCRQRGEEQALQAAALMQHGKIIELSSSLALYAAKLSIELKLPMADSIILATARLNEATLWTQDNDFEGIDGVRYFPKG
ncbi:MAG: type II toxin-antitoxin system VapC family toxin [Trichlorobacter sp.]|uniref:type II toxin-antitoxin system VapC family toxin n=1 Tax=Trichlorobacter sp. TaxID=2911007 RepID=UPI002565F83C|nr:type II toxin-antitoxin system VapC family toxin [Trichlorobacter sp.]MDK9718594.1 type II toxin-antitoxin system VapC family toxin [Trichlorobacter sp.]